MYRLHVTMFDFRYVSDSKLGDGSLVGEKVTIASQRIVTEAGLSSPQPTRQIAASMRSCTFTFLFLFVIFVGHFFLQWFCLEFGERNRCSIIFSSL